MFDLGESGKPDYRRIVLAREGKIGYKDEEIGDEERMNGKVEHPCEQGKEYVNEERRRYEERVE